MEPGPPKLFWFPGVPVSGVKLFWFPGVPVSGVIELYGGKSFTEARPPELQSFPESRSPELGLRS